MIRKPDRNAVRKKRHLRVRKSIIGTAERPRLNVFRSLKHIYAQIIDDQQCVTLVAASSLDPELRDQSSSGSTVESAGKVGELLAQRAQESGIKQVVFDRAGYRYHGRVAALADAARKAGLEF